MGWAKHGGLAQAGLIHDNALGITADNRIKTNHGLNTYTKKRFHKDQLI